ncbi:MAG: Copper-sensing transcriptional repressor CsoR [Anaerolineae bacterium]|nr:Copper-sensing transcriptional repressor CsoR [Anaerolineae bacterium]
MTDDVKNNIKRIEKHIKSISRMIENDASFCEVIGQIKAVQAALRQTKLRLLDRHLHTCLVNATQPNSSENLDQVYQRLIKLFEVREKY